MPGHTSETLIDVAKTYGAHNYAPLPVVLCEGEGAWVRDVEGHHYLDMLGAYSAMSFGHRHPELIAAARTQLDRLTLTSRAFHNDQLPLFCKELAELLHHDLVLPMNSGAEAVETAIKAARRWGYLEKRVEADQARIIAFENNFHGRTTTIVGISTTPSAYEHFGPFSPGFDIVPFDDVEAVEEAMRPETVAVLVEPIQGEGGVVVPKSGYLRELRRLCDEHQALLLCDEIQTGLGRTGAVLDAHNESVQADISIVGKALGGGIVPLSACAGSRQALGVFEPGTHGSTFGGNPFAAAIGRAAIGLLRDNGMISNAHEMGSYLAKGLASIDSPLVVETRGRGLLRAIVLSPDARPARDYSEALMDRRVLTKGTRGNILRFAPPLQITRAELDFALEHITAVLQPGAV